MANTVTVRGLTIGQGVPKMIVPIVGKTRAEIREQAAGLCGSGADMAEWRVDFFDGALDVDQTCQLLAELRPVLGELPLLFTFRTAGEGGARAIAPERYAALLQAAAESGHTDLIDVEVFFGGDDAARANIDSIHRAGRLVVGSNHDFAGTPPKEEIVSRLRRMQRLGADIPKIAMMPTCPADVLTLLAATDEMRAQWADRPIVTMSMGPTGVISRLCGEVFGSAMTFGAVGRVSAPGQVPLEELAAVLGILHRAL